MRRHATWLPGGGGACSRGRGSAGKSRFPPLLPSCFSPSESHPPLSSSVFVVRTSLEQVCLCSGSLGSFSAPHLLPPGISSPAAHQSSQHKLRFWFQLVSQDKLARLLCRNGSFGGSGSVEASSAEELGSLIISWRRRGQPGRPGEAKRTILSPPSPLPPPGPLIEIWRPPAAPAPVILWMSSTGRRGLPSTQWDGGMMGTVNGRR